MGQWWIHSLVQSGQVPLLLSWVFWVIFSICLHELAHGWAAIRQGDNTPRELGHMTMNPLVHMGPISLLMFALIGIAWGLMPTNPARYRSGRLGRFYVAIAGPAMNIGLALISLTLGAFWSKYGPQGTDFANNVETFFFIGGMLNIVLAGFNMLPVPPLDGSQVLSGLSWRCYQFFQKPQAQMFGLFIVLAMLITGTFGIIFQVARTVASLYMLMVEAVLP
ncbi:MAG TPA: site-2 protease family protein [Phycisphaerales bacterium]|nr:site-2 protease family protein [Phycisphaerales bacterium]HRQ74927.1 site-2 protease family protein [Phycisphaerales bacterium]